MITTATTKKQNKTKQKKIKIKVKKINNNNNYNNNNIYVYAKQVYNLQPKFIQCRKVKNFSVNVSLLFFYVTSGFWIFDARTCNIYLF